MTMLATLLAALQLFLFGPETVPPEIVASVAAKPGISATVSLSTQRMYVVVIDKFGLKRTYAWKVSTGKEGFDTPTGAFKPTVLSIDHRSRTYDNAPMPYAVFFTGGYAVHATDAVARLGRPASHGCVRLALENAATFFGLVESYGMRNTKIEIRV